MLLTVKRTEISICGKTPTRRNSVTSAERLMPMFSPFTQVRRSKNNVVCVMQAMSASRAGAYINVWRNASDQQSRKRRTWKGSWDHRKKFQNFKEMSKCMIKILSFNLEMTVETSLLLNVNFYSKEYFVDFIILGCNMEGFTSLWRRLRRNENNNQKHRLSWKSLVKK